MENWAGQEKNEKCGGRQTQGMGVVGYGALMIAPPPSWTLTLRPAPSDIVTIPPCHAAALQHVRRLDSGIFLQGVFAGA
jgi:hypothetical protein